MSATHREEISPSFFWNASFLRAPHPETTGRRAEPQRHDGFRASTTWPRSSSCIGLSRPWMCRISLAFAHSGCVPRARMRSGGGRSQPEEEEGGVWKRRGSWGLGRPGGRKIPEKRKWTKVGTAATHGVLLQYYVTTTLLVLPITVYKNVHMLNCSKVLHLVLILYVSTS